MTRFRSIVFALTSFAPLIWPLAAAAQQIALEEFPASAQVRGENVWLRLEPAAETEVVTLLQRGDPITITGASVFDGQDEFYPVDAELTGESGWIEVLFIDPRSLSDASTVVVPLEEIDIPLDETDTVDDGGNQRQQNREARRLQRQAETDAAAEPAPEAEDPAAARAARRAAREAEQDAAAVEEQPAADQASRRAERQAQQNADSAGANNATDALTFNGEESTVTPEFTPPADAITIAGNFEGERAFVVLAIAPDGTEQIVFDERGPFSGETTLQVDSASTLVLDVQANGAWEIIVTPSP